MRRTRTWIWIVGMAMFAAACGGGDTTTDDASAATETTTTTVAPTTTAAPTTAAPTTTAGPEEVAESVTADLRIEVEFASNGVGSFEVVEGADVFGCESGEFFPYPLSGWTVIDLNCEVGGSGILTVLPVRDAWRAIDATGDFAGTSGYGDANIDPAAGVGWFAGTVATGGPEERSTPSEQFDRLVPLDAPCFDGFGSTDGLYEYGTVGDVLQSLDLVTGDITDHGPAPVPCALWLGDPVTGRAVASNPEQTTLWLGPLGGDLDTQVDLGVPSSIISRSIRANRLLVSTGTEITMLDATTGDVVGAPISGDAGNGRSFSAHAVSPDESLIAIGSVTSNGSVVSVVDAVSGDLVFTLDATERIVSLTFDPATGELLMLGEAGTLSTVDVDSQSVVAEIQVQARARFEVVGVRSDGLVVMTGWAHAVLVDRRSGPVGDPILHGVSANRVRDDGTIVGIWGQRHDIFDEYTLG